MNLRLFCALTVPRPVQDELAGVSASLRNSLSGGSISWTKPSNIHLTLSFLGDVESTRIEDLALQLRAACQGVAPFEVVCQGLGCFPSLNRPRVVWAGVSTAQLELTLLQNKVAAACAPFAQREEPNRFNPHLTLGRIREATNPMRANLATEIERAHDTIFGHWLASDVELVCSDLSQKSPHYSVLHHLPLSEPKG